MEEVKTVMRDTLKETLKVLESNTEAQSEVNEVSSADVGTIERAYTVNLAPKEKEGESVKTTKKYNYTVKTGRPTDYNQEEVLNKVEEYILSCNDEVEEFHKTRGQTSDSYERVLRVKLPSIEGLALYLGISKQCLYEWKERHSEFGDAVDKVSDLQAERVINGTMSGLYNPTIGKLLLASKHGYIEKTESTTKVQLTNTMKDLSDEELASISQKANN